MDLAGFVHHHVGRRAADQRVLMKMDIEGVELVWKSRFYGAFVLNRRVVLHAIDATPARWPPRCVAYTSADEATLLPAPEGVFQ